MECPKYSFEINESLIASYCKNCDQDCAGVRVSWISSVRMEIKKGEQESQPSEPKKTIELRECPFCNEVSLFVYPNGLYVECLNHECNITGIVVKDGEETSIHKQIIPRRQG